MSALDGRGPEVNKFKQVSSDGQQMSLAGDVPVQWGPMSRRGLWGWGKGKGLYNEVQGIMDSVHMEPNPCGQADTTRTLPSHNFVGGGNNILNYCIAIY